MIEATPLTQLVLAIYGTTRHNLTTPQAVGIAEDVAPLGAALEEPPGDLLDAYDAAVWAFWQGAADQDPGTVPPPLDQ